MAPIRTRRRHAIALVAVLLAGGGVGAVPAPTQAAGPPSRAELGFRIGRTPHADGSFVGRYRVGHQLGYRTQPRKSSAQSAYHRAHRVTHVSGRSRAATARAAWILSTYGGTPDRTTAAAVDVAVHALLSRGKWRVGRHYTVRRTNHTGVGHVIRAYAKTILRQSKHRHGPFRTTLTARRVAVGDQTTVTIRVQNKRGLGPVITGQQRGLAVRVTYHAGGRSKTAYLNNHGVGRVYFRAAAGKTRITASVHTVPDVALLLRRPNNASASKVAVAGHRRTLRLHSHGLGVSTQTLRITNRFASVLVGHPLRGTYRVTGLTGRETVDYAVYGPFAAAATSCSGAAVTTATAVISGNRTRSLPSWDPAKTGYYAWRVTARGNSTTRPASACGTAYLAQKKTSTKLSRAGVAHTVKVGHAFGPDIIVSGFDRPEVHTVRTRIYGPFLHKGKVRCTQGRLFRSLPTAIRNNKRWRETTVVNHAANTGYYVFKTTLDAGTFLRSSHSRCGNTIRVTK
jgi:hypothetical protein